MLQWRRERDTDGWTCRCGNLAGLQYLRERRWVVVEDTEVSKVWAFYCAQHGKDSDRVPWELALLGMAAPQKRWSDLPQAFTFAPAFLSITLDPRFNRDQQHNHNC